MYGVSVVGVVLYAYTLTQPTLAPLPLLLSYLSMLILAVMYAMFGVVWFHTSRICTIQTQLGLKYVPDKTMLFVLSLTMISAVISCVFHCEWLFTPTMASINKAGMVIAAAWVDMGASTLSLLLFIMYAVLIGRYHGRYPLCGRKASRLALIP